MGLYDDEAWAQLAVKAGFVPEDTEAQARRAFRYSARIIDQLFNALSDANDHLGFCDKLECTKTSGLEATIEDALAWKSTSHVLYRTGDKGVLDSICDSRGDVVLGYCKICGRGEIELKEPCAGSLL